MPEFIHERAKHLLAKNPDMQKSTAFAIATQQSHALGKTPKGYGTAEGKREAKAKYDTPKDDEHKANPGGLETPKLASNLLEVIQMAFLDELEQIKAAAVKEKDSAFANAIAPTAMKGMGSLSIPKPSKAPVIGSGDFGRTLHVGPGVTAATQNAATIAPARMAR